MKTQLNDFNFKQAGYGRYMVTYTSPITGKQWMAHTCDMQLIDATKNAENPKRCDLDQLKRVVKSNS